MFMQQVYVNSNIQKLKYSKIQEIHVFWNRSPLKQKIEFLIF